jgi:hypothetical protein
MTSGGERIGERGEEGEEGGEMREMAKRKRGR